MRNIVIGLALMLAACTAQAVSYSQPRDESRYVERDRFESVGMSGFVDYIITDKKSGCQYMWVGGHMVMLGCFEEYRNK